MSCREDVRPVSLAYAAKCPCDGCDGLLKFKGFNGMKTLVFLICDECGHCCHAQIAKKVAFAG